MQGNITNYGISDQKKQQWYDEHFIWKKPSTEYRNVFHSHHNKDLNFNRVAVPRYFNFMMKLFI